MAHQREPERKRARNQAARRGRVLEAAVALAGAGGYEAVQMRDVAEKAGVALGTLYRYFPSKDHLLVASLAEWSEDLRARLEQKPPRGDSAADRVADVLWRASRALERQPRVAAALVAALSSPDPTVADRKQGVYNTLHSIITTAIGDEDVPEKDDVVWVLGHVWFASLVYWAGGLSEAGRMGKDLEVATRLILDGRR